MAKFTKLSEAKPHPAVWLRIAHSLHWDVDLNTMLKAAGISKKNWDDNSKWVLDTYRKSSHFQSGKYNDPAFDPFEDGFDASKVPAYTD